MNEYLIKKLKEGRLCKGLKQSDVAKKIGVKGNTLSNYENGVSEPDIDTFCALCEIYDLDPADLLNEAYGLIVPGCDFSIKPSEIEFLKKYRAIDSEGQRFIDTMLDREFSRMVDCDDQLSLYIKKNQAELLNAAHSIPKATEEEKKHDEEIMNDLYF